jgi:hypothetical protein
MRKSYQIGDPFPFNKKKRHNRDTKNRAERSRKHGAAA